MVLTRTAERIKREEEEEARQIAQALALSEAQIPSTNSEDIDIIDEQAVQEESEYNDTSEPMLFEPQNALMNRQLFKALFTLAKLHAQNHQAECSA